MSFSGTLASLFIEFSTKGLDVVRDALGTAKASVEGLKKGIDAVGAAAKPAFISLSASLTGWVTAGIQGTAVADQLSFSMGQLSRSIAGMFYPELQKVIELVKRATDWFRSLSNEQRASIAHWTLGAVAALNVAVVLPKVVAGIEALIIGLRSLSVAVTLALSSTGIGALLPVLGGIAALFASLGAGAIVAEGGLGELFATLRPLLQSLAEVGKVLWEAFQPVLEIAKTVLKVFVAALVPVVKLVGSIVAAIGTALKPLLEIFGRIVEAIGGFIAQMIEAFSPLVDALGELAHSFGDLFAAAFSLLKPVLEAVLGLLAPVQKMFVELAKIIVGVVVDALRALAAVIEWIARGLAAITGSDLQKAKKTASDGDQRGDLTKTSAGFTSANDAYRRIAQQSVAAGFGKPVGERQLDIAQQQLTEQRGTNERLDRVNPPFARS